MRGFVPAERDLEGKIIMPAKSPCRTLTKRFIRYFFTTRINIQLFARCRHSRCAQPLTSLIGQHPCEPVVKDRLLKAAAAHSNAARSHLHSQSIWPVATFS